VLSVTFIDLYLRYCGTTNTPARFNEWVALSLMAAAMADHCWVEHAPNQPIAPNLYTLLIAPSGVGKGKAIERAMKLISMDEKMPRDTYYGRMSGQGLADWMGGRVSTLNTSRVSKGKVPVSDGKKHETPFVVNEELGLDIGRGQMADDFIKYLTGLYDGVVLPFRDTTRTSGQLVLERCCINWLAGSNERWLVESISTDAIEGGFFARTAIISERQPKSVIFDFQVAEDYAEVVAILQRLLAIARDVMGQFVVSSRARAVLRQWFNNRPPPNSEAHLASWNRELVMVYKVAMAYSMSEWCVAMAFWQDTESEGEAPEMVIEDRHVVQAQRALRGSHRAIPGLLNEANASPRSKQQRYIVRELQTRKKMDHSHLLRIVSGRGVTGQVLREVMRDLEEQGVVKWEMAPRNGGRKSKIAYEWVGNGKVTRGAMNHVATDDVDDDADAEGEQLH
jgi:hypothetical protein